jgi:hypothetical protein
MWHVPAYPLLVFIHFLADYAFITSMTTNKSAGVRGFLTFRRLFPLAFFLMVFALAVRQSAYIDPDLWWHLQAGQDIVQSQSIPKVDTYSFTKLGSEWVAHEWLSEVVMFFIYKASGWGGLLFVFSVLITVTLYLTYRRCEGKPYAAALAILLAAGSSSPLFGIRPQMITLLLVTIFIGLLTRYSDDGEGKRLWCMVPIMFLWVNLHGGYVIGLGLIGLYIISLLLDRKWHLVPRLGLMLLITAAVVPLNPNGFRMFIYPFETLGLAATSFIDEWASPNFHQLMFLPFALLLFGLLGALALSARRPRLGELFLLLMTAFGALRSARHIPIFTLIATPILARHVWDIMVSHGWDKRFTGIEAPATGFALVFNLIFLLAPATLGVVRVSDFVVNQPAYEAKNYPQAAVNFLLEKQLPGPIYNRYGWGGYLIRRLYPNYRVYIDGRADVYGDSFTVEAVRTYDGYPQWRKPLERLGIRTVIIAPDAPLSSLLREADGWTKTYEDKQAVIFTRPEVEVANKAVESSSANALTMRQ